MAWRAPGTSQSCFGAAQASYSARPIQVGTKASSSPWMNSTGTRMRRKAGYDYREANALFFQIGLDLLFHLHGHMVVSNCQFHKNLL